VFFKIKTMVIIISLVYSYSLKYSGIIKEKKLKNSSIDYSLFVKIW